MLMRKPNIKLKKGSTLQCGNCLRVLGISKKNFHDQEMYCLTCLNDSSSTQDEPRYILLVWDKEKGEHKQMLLNKSFLQNVEENVEGTVFLSGGMPLQKTYEEELKIINKCQKDSQDEPRYILLVWDENESETGGKDVKSNPK